MSTFFYSLTISSQDWIIICELHCIYFEHSMFFPVAKINLSSYSADSAFWWYLNFLFQLFTVIISYIWCVAKVHVMDFMCHSKIWCVAVSHQWRYKLFVLLKFTLVFYESVDFCVIYIWHIFVVLRLCFYLIAVQSQNQAAATKYYKEINSLHLWMF